MYTAKEADVVIDLAGRGKGGAMGGGKDVTSCVFTIDAFRARRCLLPTRQVLSIPWTKTGEFHPLYYLQGLLHLSRAPRDCTIHTVFLQCPHHLWHPLGPQYAYLLSFFFISGCCTSRALAVVASKCSLRTSIR